MRRGPKKSLSWEDSSGHWFVKHFSWLLRGKCLPNSQGPSPFPILLTWIWIHYPFRFYWRVCLCLHHSSTLQFYICCVVFFKRSTWWFQVLPTGLLLVLKSANIYKKNTMAIMDLWQVYTAHGYPTEGMGGVCRQFSLVQVHSLDWMEVCLLLDSFSCIIWNYCILKVGFTCTSFALKWYELY